jgi:hypothetical protein
MENKRMLMAPLNTFIDEVAKLSRGKTKKQNFENVVLKKMPLYIIGNSVSGTS